VSEIETGDNMNKYIITKSDLVSEVLKKSGYTLMSHKDGIWTFFNDGKKMLSAEDKKGMVFTNKIFL